MASVYVGTYGKYNNGSIAGAWINLDNCDNYAAFLNKCAEVHKDERDPEYMIQDSEGFPEGLDCLEWLNEADFNDVKNALKEEAEAETPSAFTIVDYSEKAIAVTGDTKPLATQFKDLGGRFNPRLSCGAGWIFSKKKEAELRALLSGSQVAAIKKEGAGVDYRAIIGEWIAANGLEADRAKGCAAAVKLPEGYYIISKPSIENRFCFSDEGPEYEFYKSLLADESKMRQYFLSENLRDLDAKIKAVSDTSEETYVKPAGWRGEAYIVTSQYRYDYMDAFRENRRRLTTEERTEIAEALRSVRADFEKRLQTYLKRYGVSKLHTWSYWADR